MAPRAAGLVGALSVIGVGLLPLAAHSFLSSPSPLVTSPPLWSGAAAFSTGRRGARALGPSTTPIDGVHCAFTSASTAGSARKCLAPLMSMAALTTNGSGLGKQNKRQRQTAAGAIPPAVGPKRCEGSSLCHGRASNKSPVALSAARAPYSPALANIALVQGQSVVHLLTHMQPSVVRAAIKAVVKLLASCGVGVGLAKKGVLDQAALSVLSRLIFYVFQPALLFVNVALTLASNRVSYAKIAVLPIFACLQILFGQAVAMVMERVVGMKPGSPEGRELQMCTSFGNSGPLPLLFVDSIFGAHIDPTLCASAVAYISFYLLGWSPMFWTAGYSMLAGKPSSSMPLTDTDKDREAKYGILKKLVVKMQRFKAKPTVKRVASPPVMGCLLGVVAGLCPPIRALLVQPGAPLSPLFDALKTFGSAYLPAAILVLAGSFARSGAGGAKSSLTSLRKTGPFLKKVSAVCAARFIIMPLGAAAMLLTGSRFGLIPYDKLLWFVLLMQGCMPSAQNSVVILQMEKEPELARSMARTLSAVYLLSAIPTAILLSAILQFVQL